jgi:putative FmdB family regulatory protein
MIKKTNIVVCDLNNFLENKTMPFVDYKCEDCGFVDDFITGKTVADSNPPETCPKCNSTNWKKVDDFSGIGFDVKGYCYNNVYGKKAPFTNGKLDVAQQARVLMGDRDPY